MKPVDHTPLTSKSFLVSVAFLANALLVSLAWLYFVSHGFTANGIVDGVYEIQASMLAQGRLSIVPGPLERFYHDALLYWGQYYFYWGLLPSAVLLLLTTLFGRFAGHCVTVFGFLFLFVSFYQWIVARILACASVNTSGGSERSGPRTAGTIGAMSLTWVLIFVIPFPGELGWFFGRFAVYEQQVLFGLALAFPGLYLLVTGIEQNRPGPLGMGALLFALAAWTRVTWVPLALMVLPAAGVLIWRWRRAGDPESSPRRGMVALGLAVALMGGLLLVNYVRFDSPFDFGVRFQNPGHYAYFRNAKLFFSKMTLFWNALFNTVSYYASPHLAESLGLASRSFAHYEGPPPSFFAVNPQFLPLAVLIPLGLYRTVKKRNGLALWLGALLAVTLYLNIVLGLFGTFVILRYFVEFSYFMILALLAVLLSLVRPQYGVPIFVLMLALHIPSAVVSFRGWWPELRTADAGNGLRITSPDGTTPFIEQSVRWPIGSFSAADLNRLPPYAAMGVDPGKDGTVTGKDIFAVYLVPGNDRSGSTAAVLEIRGLAALQTDGEALIFFENRLLRSQSLSTKREVDVRLELPFRLDAAGPYQVMVIFLRPGESYLPGRSRGTPLVSLREISLKRPPLPEASRSLLPGPTRTNGTYTKR